MERKGMQRIGMRGHGKGGEAIKVQGRAVEEKCIIKGNN
jgi:hypothetical protein